MLPLKKRAKKLVNVITPMAPICIITAMMNSPRVVNVDGRSTVDNPVTQTADVLMNSESVNDMPENVHCGIISSADPIKMSIKNDEERIRAGLMRWPIMRIRDTLRSSAE